MAVHTSCRNECIRRIRKLISFPDVAVGWGTAGRGTDGWHLWTPARHSLRVQLGRPSRVILPQSKQQQQQLLRSASSCSSILFLPLDSIHNKRCRPLLFLVSICPPTLFFPFASAFFVASFARPHVRLLYTQHVYSINWTQKTLALAVDPSVTPPIAL